MPLTAQTAPVPEADRESPEESFLIKDNKGKNLLDSQFRETDSPNTNGADQDRRRGSRQKTKYPDSPPKGDRQKSVGRNAVLNVVRVACQIILPMVTLPYCSRILQVENMGKVNFAFSLVTFFALLADLGVSVYGVREGTKRSLSRRRFDRFASEVFAVNILMTAVSYALLALIMFLVPGLRQYVAVVGVQSLFILFTTMGIEWVNAVYEDYFFIAVRTILIQVLYTASVFILVRRQEDYLLFTFLTVMVTGAASIANWIYCRRYVTIRPVPEGIRKHFRPMSVFFANNMAITVYVNADMAMLGLFCGDYYTGSYGSSMRIYQCMKTLMTAIYTVTIPRLSMHAAKGEKEPFRRLLTDVCASILLLIVPVIVGLILYADDIMELVFGASYLPGALSLQLLAAALLFAVGNGIAVNCVNAPLGEERVSMMATICAAVSNVALNLFMIPLFKEIGAAVTTIAAEALVLVICLVRLPGWSRLLDLRVLGRNTLHTVAGALFLAAVRLIFAPRIASLPVRMAAAILVSAAGYGIVLLLLRNEYLIGILRRKKQGKAAE